MVHFILPEYEKQSFTCPHCWVVSRQEWTNSYRDTTGEVKIATCDNCGEFSIWHNIIRFQSWFWNIKWTGMMVFPKYSSIPLPNDDLTPDIKADYIEAWRIIDDSPRWACALLRLALQKLMIQLWEGGRDINSDIWNLVKAWLNPTIQKALDTVRVIWNESVHPGEIDMKDNKDIAIKLFWLINLIANALITQPKEVEELYYWVIPDSKLDGIENRDN